MINVKKGVAHSLQQTDIRGNWTGNTINAGSVATVNASGNVVLGGTGSTGLRGFTINNSIDGDVIESGKIALYTFDGHSVIETDQVDTVASGALTAANWPVGTAVYASSSVPGLVTQVSTSNGNAIGYIEGIRYLQNATPFPSGQTQTSTYTSDTESAAIAAGNAAGYTSGPIYAGVAGKTATYKAQVNVPVLGIKLAATN